MNEPIDYIASKRAEIKALEDLNNKVTNNKAQFSMNAVGVLLKTFQEIASDILDNQEKTEHFDKDLGNKISESISKTISEFTKIKPPTVTVNPKIEVNLQPLESIAESISGQNETIIELLKNIPQDNDDKYIVECYKLIVGMIAKNNQLVEKVFSQSDMPKEIESKEIKKELLSMKIQRDNFGNLKEIIPVYK